MIEPFDTNRDPGDENDHDEPVSKGKDYFLKLDENGCLSFQPMETNRKQDDTTD